MVLVTDSAFRLVAELQRKANVALTGGAVVQILSRGLFITGDADLVLIGGEDKSRVEPILWDLGFVRRGAYWIDSEGENLYQIVGPYFDRVTEVEYGGLKLRTVCLEYLLAFRLLMCSRGETRMCEQALFLLEGYKENLDMPYLQELLRRFKVDESFLGKAKLKRLSARKTER